MRIAMRKRRAAEQQAQITPRHPAHRAAKQGDLRQRKPERPEPPPGRLHGATAVAMEKIEGPAEALPAQTRGAQLAPRPGYWLGA